MKESAHSPDKKLWTLYTPTPGGIDKSILSFLLVKIKEEFNMPQKTYTEEGMRIYIQRTNLPRENAYQIRCGEIKTLAEMVYQGEWVQAICLAYEYGKAKGVRMAKRRT